MAPNTTSGESYNDWPYVRVKFLFIGKFHSTRCSVGDRDHSGCNHLHHSQIDLTSKIPSHRLRISIISSDRILLSSISKKIKTQKNITHKDTYYRYKCTFRTRGIYGSGGPLDCGTVCEAGSDDVYATVDLPQARERHGVLKVSESTVALASHRFLIPTDFHAEHPHSPCPRSDTRSHCVSGIIGVGTSVPRTSGQCVGCTAQPAETAATSISMS